MTHLIIRLNCDEADLRHVTRKNHQDSLECLLSSFVALHHSAQDPQTGHDLVPVQVTAFEEARVVWVAHEARPAVQQAPVIEGHNVTWK